nr:peroxisomal and mitochondrial division factor 1-like [Arachis hypogaea]
MVRHCAKKRSSDDKIGREQRRGHIQKQRGWEKQKQRTARKGETAIMIFADENMQGEEKNEKGEQGNIIVAMRQWQRRLQHDSISDMSAAEKMMAEAAELRKLLSEIESKVEFLEREVKFLKKDKSESEEKIRDLEKKIGALEKKDVDERNKLTRLKRR